MSKDKSTQETLQMTSDTIGRDLLQALVQEIKLLPDAWPVSCVSSGSKAGRLGTKSTLPIKRQI